MNRCFNIALSFSIATTTALPSFAGGTTRTNPPSACSAPDKPCSCPVNGDNVKGDCIKVQFDLGWTTPWTGSLDCSLKIFADDDAPEIFTLESLHAVVGGYTFKRLGQKNLADGETPAEVVFSHPNGESVSFAFKDGNSWGVPDPGVHRDMDERVLMVDAEGWAVTSDPVYYDLYVGDGTRRRFLATDATSRRGTLVSITDARGVTNTPEQMGIDIVYDPAGVRQFLTPSRLADVSHLPDWSGYEVTVYALGGEIPAKDSTTGLYDLPSAPPVKRLSLRRENGGKRAVVTIRRGTSDPQRHVFEYVSGDWSLTRASGVREEKERIVADSRAARTVSVVRAPDGTLLSRRESNYKWMSWGFAMTNRVDGFGGITDTTAWTYYTGGNGKGQVKTEKRQSGLQIDYAYDSENRIVSETRSGPGMMTETTTYAYESVDPADIVPPVDTRPRTVVRTLDGIECSRTYYVYSPLTNVVERVGEQGAAFGGTNALRTVTAYYPVVSGDIRSGFVKSIRHEDGRLNLYDYALSSNRWTRTITHVHESSPAPVEGKTTREITVTNGRDNEVETRTEAFVGGQWRAISRERRTFNAEGNVVRRENLAGQVTTTEWDCCHKVSETQPDGSITTWDYDVEGREVASSKLIPLDMTNVTWLTTCREYDGLGRETAAWQTNFAAQVGLPPLRIRHDALGRVSARIDELGNETATSYDQSGRVSSTVNPNGATRTTARGADGRTISVTGTAVTPEFHAYGVLSDGTRWTRTVQGETAQSPRFTTRYENMLGQIVREERSGFRSAVLATMHEYDTYGHLVRTIADGEPAVEFAYDAFGNHTSTTRSVDAGTAGNSAPVAEWRRTRSENSYIVDGGDVWIAATNVNSCSDSSIAPLVTAVERQLTGLSAALPECSRTVDVRGHVTVNTQSVSAPDVLAIQTVPYATNNSISVSRYGVKLRTASVSCVTNTFAYDALGRRVARTDGRGNTTRTEYNAFGQTSATIDALGNRTEYAYDQFGNLASVTDPLGNAKVYEYDLRGRKSYEGGATYPVRYTYDVFGNLSTLSTTRDPAANLSTFQPFNFSTVSWDTTTWLYDEASGALTNKVYADGMGPAYDYTPGGRLFRRAWARGIVTDYAYDSWGNLTNTVYSDETPTISIAYDAMGRMASAVVEGVSTNLYFHSAYGDLTNEVQNGVSIARSYDCFGRPTGYYLNPVNPVNPVQNVCYSYDAFGRFSSVVAGTNVFEYSRLPGSDLVSGYTSGPFRRAVSYEPQRDLIATVTNAFGTTLISAFNYANDATGRRVSRIDTFDGAVTTNTFGYNFRSEVTSAAMWTNSYGYAYDPIGNRLFSSHNTETNAYTANSLNQYTSISNFCASVPPCEPSYDADGNMTADGRGWHYVWNGENRMVSASNAEAVVTYAYDHRGHMVRKEISRGDAESQSIAYHWDGWNIISETTENLSTFQPFNLSPSYVWGLDIDGTLQGAGGVGGLLAVIQFDCTATNSPTPNSSTRQLYLPTYDANGNIAEYVSSNDDIVAHYGYSPFGEPVVSSGELAVSFAHKFSTKPYCNITSLSEYQMRKVRLDAGRFFNRDPICENGGVNIYVFSNNSPVSFFEELGLKCIQEGNPRLLPNEDWHLQSVDFDFHNERGHIFLDGIKSNWRRKGIVNCCCNGQSVQKTVYRIHSQTYPFSSQTGGPIVTQTLNISGATDIPLPTSAHAALADLFGMFLNNSVTFPLGVDPNNIGRLKSGLKATAPNDSSGSWPENPCN